MQTDWDLVRRTMNATIDACENMEALQIKDCEKGNGQICVGDFLNRFAEYPQGCARDIIRLRSRIAGGVWHKEQKYHRELARALISTATACAEIIGLDNDGLSREYEDHVAHCDSAGKSVGSHLMGIGQIYAGWMLPEIRNALDDWRNKNKYDCEVEDCPHQPLCTFYEEIQAGTKQDKTDAGNA